MTVVQRCLARSYVPVMLIGGNGFAIWMVAQGGSPIWLILVGVIAVGISFAAEQLLPFSNEWNHWRGDARRDVLHALVNKTLSEVSVWSVPVLAAFVPWSGIWPSDWPLLAQWLIALLVADCGITLVHCWSHHSRILWRLHAVHHSVERMYGLNGLMKHPLHQALETLAGVSPLLLAGMPQEIAMLLAFSVTIQLLLQHSNVDVELGILGRWLALGATHRLHHLADSVRGNVNFGLFTTIWDRLLGTAVLDPCIDDTTVNLGLAGHPDYPKAYLAQLIEPFRTTAEVKNESRPFEAGRLST